MISLVRKKYYLHQLINAVIISLVFMHGVVPAHAQKTNYRELEKQAEEYFDDKEYPKAVAIWLNILDNDPENVRVQKRIEELYELKQKKAIELQKSKLYSKITRKRFQQEQLKEGISYGTRAIDSFITAYRIDPKDPEMEELLVDMRELEKEINAAKELVRISEEKRKRYEQLKALALKAMEEEKYEEALTNWEKILRFLPKDVDAVEGKRKCKLAIDNRLKFEKIKSYLAKGTALFNNEQFQQAQIEFEQVLKIDPSNREAKGFINEIAEKLEEKRLSQERIQQAEDFYVSGINNLKKENFDQAEEDFESALALVENYKDARARLNSIDRLRKEYIAREKARKLETINKEFQDGILALSDGRYSDAIAAFNKTLYLDPKNDIAKRYLAQAKDAQRLLEEEEVDINSPYYDIVNALSLSGIDHYKKGNFQESIRMWDKILELFPKNKNANIYRLKCYIKINPGSYKEITSRTIKDGKELLKKRDFGGALKKFELIKSISPRYSGINSLIAQARRGLSVGSAKTLTGKEKQDVTSLYKRALVLYGRGGLENYKQAAELLRTVVDKDPNNTKAVISLNKIEVQLRGVGGVVEAQGKVLTAEEKQKALRFYNQGISYFANNQYSQAIREWRKVLAIDPGNIKAKNNIRKTIRFINR